MDELMDISERIMRLRKELDLTQSGLGKLAGVSKAAVSQWESGTTVPQRVSLSMLKENCSINPDYIINGAKPKYLYQEGATNMDIAPNIDAQLDQLSTEGLLSLLNKVTARLTKIISNK